MHRKRDKSHLQLWGSLGSLAVLTAAAAPASRLEIGTPVSEQRLALGPETAGAAVAPTRSREQTQYLDAGDPTPEEQYYLELINQARSDPVAEAARHGIDLNGGLPAGTISTAPKQPLAANRFLIAAGRAHSQWMLDNNTLSHTGVNDSTPWDRMRTAGYALVDSAGWRSGENVAWDGNTAPIVLAESVPRLHAGFVTSPNHRTNVMEPVFREMGLGVLLGQFTEQGETYNAAMATEVYGQSGKSPVGAEGSRFLLGVVYQDRDKNGFYTPGEGMSGVTVRPGLGSFYAVTATAGGYALPLASGTGPLTVYISGGDLPWTYVKQVQRAGANLKLDLVYDPDVPPPALDFVISVSPVSVPEGGSAAATVSLSGAPATDLTFSVERVSGHAGFTVEALDPLEFSPQDYAGRRIVVHASESDDQIDNLTAVLRVHKLTGANPVPDLDVPLQEVDDDVRFTVVANGPGGTTDPAGAVLRDLRQLPLTVWADPNPGVDFVEWRAPASVQIASPRERTTTVTTTDPTVDVTVTAFFAVGDSDLDGMKDAWEIDVFGSIEARDGTLDFDGDGITDFAEFVAGLNPKVKDNNTRVVVLGAGWNLVSIPTGLAAPTVAAVFGSVPTGLVWTWDAATQTYVPAADPLSDLAGYWLYVGDRVALILRLAPGR